MYSAGHYRALEWNEKEQKYMDNGELGIIVEVTVRLFRHLLPERLLKRLSSRKSPRARS